MTIFTGSGASKVYDGSKRKWRKLMIDRTTVETNSHNAKPIGRVLRFAMGAALISLLIAQGVLDAAANILWQSSAVFVGLIALYSAIHFIVLRFLSTINAVLGTIIALSPAILVYYIAGDAGQIAVIAYIGSSLLIDAVTADIGCEVMAIPGILFRRRTHLCCIAFSPIDWIESRVSGTEVN